jgi:hypothetical protein
MKLPRDLAGRALVKVGVIALSTRRVVILFSTPKSHLTREYPSQSGLTFNNTTRRVRRSQDGMGMNLHYPYPTPDL